MATGSRGSIGALLASGFAERVNSAANLILTKGNTLLSDEKVNMLVVLRMNRDFMKYMRKYYAHIDRSSLATTITVEDNAGEKSNSSCASGAGSEAGAGSAAGSAKAQPRKATQISLVGAFAKKDAEKTQNGILS